MPDVAGPNPPVRGRRRTYVVDCNTVDWHTAVCEIYLYIYMVGSRVFRFGVTATRNLIAADRLPSRAGRMRAGLRRRCHKVRIPRSSTRQYGLPSLLGWRPSLLKLISLEAMAISLEAIVFWLEGGGELDGHRGGGAMRVASHSCARAFAVFVRVVSEVSGSCSTTK